VEKGYPKTNPYHNGVHATDITHNVCWFLATFEFSEDLDPSYVFALIIAALIHDYKHPGYSNNYLINTKDTLAIRYNDTSIIENFSLASAFELIMQGTDGEGSCNIFQELDRKYSVLAQFFFFLGCNWTCACTIIVLMPLILGTLNLIYFLFRFVAETECLVRSTIIKLVHHTDMATHFTLLATAEAKEVKGFDFDVDDDVAVLLSLLLHLSDISNPAKPADIAHRWALSVMDEFRRQGREERERGLKISMFMDPDGGEREAMRCQHAFIEFFVEPMLGLFVRVIETKKPYLMQNVRTMQDCLERNKVNAAKRKKTATTVISSHDDSHHADSTRKRPNHPSAHPAGEGVDTEISI
jgi:hypothetical protein